jgi:cell wall-associated NlpC family hydrolase
MNPVRRFASLFVVLAVLAGAFSLTPDAGAQSVADKRAEAERIAAELNQLEIQASQLDEAHHQALLQLEQTQRDILEAEARVAELEESLGHQQGQLEAYAVEAYIGGDTQPSMDTMLESSAPNEVGTKVAYLEAASGDRQDLIDQLGGAQAELDAELAHLRDAEAEATRLEDEARTALDGAQQAVADHEAIQSRVQGELATLVAEEEARRAAEERRRAEEAARRAAEEARQAAPPAAPPAEEIEELNDDPPATPPTTVAEPAEEEDELTETEPVEEPEPVEETTPPTGPSAGASGAVALAYSLLGTPYVWGGGSPSSGFDCSGFTSYVWGQNGKSLPHSAAAQSAMVTRLPLSELQPGDLVFYGYGYVHHVALYVGGGTIIHAPRKGDVVKVDSIYYWDDLHWAGRLP